MNGARCARGLVVSPVRLQDGVEVVDVFGPNGLEEHVSVERLGAVDAQRLLEVADALHIHNAPVVGGCILREQLANLVEVHVAHGLGRLRRRWPSAHDSRGSHARYRRCDRSV